jgi:4-amino-4-deoxy-L-arabinose transferase-like glycosyltransferase
MTVLSNKGGASINKSIAFWAFIFVYAALIIYWCYTINIWVDETYSLDTSSYNLRGVISQSYNFEGQPPAYFVFLSLWRTFNSGIFFARLFSAVSIGIAAWVFYKLVTLISGKDRSLWFVVLFLLNPYTVWASTQARLYAFLLLLAMVSVYFFFKFFTAHKNKYLVIFGITAVIGIYTQYLYLFLLAALGVSILLFLGWKLFFKYCLYLIPAAAVFLQNILFTTSPVKLAYVGSIKESFLTKMIGVFHTPQNLMLNLDMLPFGRYVRWAVIAIFVLVLGFAYLKLYKNNKDGNKTYLNKINSILISGILLVLCIALLFAKTGIDYNDRYLTIGFPLLVLLWLMLNVYEQLKRVLLFSLFTAYYILLLFFNYKYPVNDFDSRALAAYITRIEKQDEPVLFYPKVLALPFKYYYNGKNVIAPLPDRIRLDSTYLAKIEDTIQLKQAIERAGNSSGSYLLITNRNDARFENEADIKVLNAYLSVHYTITTDTLFSGKYNPLRVRRMNKK